MGTGFLEVVVDAAFTALPIANASVTVSQGGSVLSQLTTGADGHTGKIEIEAPDKSVTLDPEYTGTPYAHCDVQVKADGFTVKEVYDVMILDTEITILPVHMTPAEAHDFIQDPQPEDTYDNDVHLPEHNLTVGGERAQEHGEYSPARQRILRDVVIPHYIVVHLGKPEEKVSNVTVEFKYYIKNVCSHEIYPTWPTTAIEANIHCQVSLALNRIYTEWYPSQGYNFDITSSTWYDQNFVYQGEVFANISVIVDRIFNLYARRPGHREPYFTEYCDGIKATCPGLKQWGTVTLAQEGYTPIQILQYYYGNDIELVEGNNITDVDQSYPGYILREGMSGAGVKALQDYLNRIRLNYPSIPQITNPNGYFGPETTAAVEAFKQAAEWPSASDTSGNVDKATWYNISFAYYAVKKLGELASEGEVIGVGRTPPAAVIQEGSQGTDVGRLQYLLDVVDDFYPEVPHVLQDYNFSADTANAVKEFQQAFDLPADGIVGPDTWQKLYQVYWLLKDSGMLDKPEPPSEGLPPYPGSSLAVGSRGDSVRQLQQCLNNIASRYPSIGKLTADGAFGGATRNAVIAFQNIFGLTADGADVIIGVWLCKAV